MVVDEGATEAEPERYRRKDKPEYRGTSRQERAADSAIRGHETRDCEKHRGTREHQPCIGKIYDQEKREAEYGKCLERKSDEPVLRDGGLEETERYEKRRA